MSRGSNRSQPSLVPISVTLPAVEAGAKAVRVEIREAEPVGAQASPPKVLA